MTAVEPIRTRVAHWGWEDHQFCGHKVFAELGVDETLGGITALAITQRRVTPEERAVIDDLTIVITHADPRIWPLKITRLVASYGADLPATAAGISMLRKARIGPWACADAAQTLLQVKTELGDRSEDPDALRAWVEAYLAKHPFIPGYGTPFRPRDERVVALRAMMERRGRTRLPYWRTMDALAAVVLERCHAEPNIGSGIGATWLDLGFAADQVGSLVTSLVSPSFVANAIEGARQKSPQLRRLPDACVNYVGTAARVSPRARGEAQ